MITKIIIHAYYPNNISNKNMDNLFIIEFLNVYILYLTLISKSKQNFTQLIP